jgi:hypothetical protein
MFRDRQFLAQRASSKLEIGRRGRAVEVSRRIIRPSRRLLLVPGATHDLCSGNDVGPVLARAAWVAAMPAR